jgi:hypothetical protein
MNKVRLKLALPALILALGTSAAPLATLDAAAAKGASFAWKVQALPPATGRHRASFGEPGIISGHHHKLVINAARANVGYPTLWVSRDNGVTWGRGRDFDASGSRTGDADAQIGADGHLYALNLAFKNPPSQSSNPAILIYRSRDWHHWRGPADFPPPHGQDQPDRPWLVTDPSRAERVDMFNSEGVGDIVAWRSHDHARSFAGPIPVTGASNAGSMELSSRPLIDPNHHKRIFMIYEASSTNTPSPGTPRDFPVTQLWTARSDDGGLTWTNTVALDISTAFGSSGTGGSLGHILPASAIDTAGNLYAVFSLRRGDHTRTHLYLVHSTDRGDTWSGPVRVDSSPLASNVLPAISAGTPGRLDVSWYGSRAGDFTAAHARWGEMFAQSLDALAAHPSFAQSRISRPGHAVHVGSVNCAGNPGSNLYDWDLRDFQGITVDAGGMAHVTWTNDRHRGRIYVARQRSGHRLLVSARR